MAFPRFWAFGAALIVAAGSGSLAQETGKKDSARSNLAEVRLNDGSIVRMTLLQDSIDVQTKFGKLTIPFREVRRIEFGVHVPASVNEQIDQAVRLLGSEVFKEREEAAKGLIQAGHLAFPSLQKAAKSGDMEVAQRANHVLKKITDKIAPDNLRLRDEDLILTGDFPVVGKITSGAIKAHSSHFGELSLRLGDMRSLLVRNNSGETEITIDAARHGSAPDQWLDSGMNVDPSLRMVILSEGQVDLWPQGPGQYITSPKGYTTAGRGGQFQAGALVARVGENGKAFLVGERFEGTPSDEGRLYFHVVPSPWNNASSGSYRVRVATDHVALTRR